MGHDEHFCNKLIEFLCKCSRCDSNNLADYLTKSVIVEIWRSTCSFDELECKWSKKIGKKIVHHEEKCNPQLEFNKIQKCSNRISSTSQAVQTGSYNAFASTHLSLTYFKGHDIL